MLKEIERLNNMSKEATNAIASGHQCKVVSALESVMKAAALGVVLKETGSPTTKAAVASLFARLPHELGMAINDSCMK